MAETDTHNSIMLLSQDGAGEEYSGGGSGGASSNSALGQGYAVCDTAESTAAKTATINGYQLKDGGIVAIKFTNAVPAGSTLNINSKGAKPIYYMGEPIINRLIGSGVTASFMYDGTKYMYLSADMPDKISYSAETETLTIPASIGFYDADTETLVLR